MLSIDGTFIVIFLSFIIFMALMKVVYFAPIIQLKQKREEIMQADYQSMEAAIQKAEQLTSQQKEKLADARFKSQQIIQEKRELAKKTAAEKLSTSRQKMVSDLERQTAQLKSDRERTYEFLKTQQEEFAQTIVEKLVKRQATKAGASASPVL